MRKLKKNSILVIDDEKANILALTSILQAEYKVHAVVNSLEAIEAAETEKPDIILLDIIMPDLDGYDVITALKSTEKTKDIPIVFISGLNNIEAEEKALALGAADYITKPFNDGIVKLRIRNQIQLIKRLRQQALMTKLSHNFLVETRAGALYADTLRWVGEFMDIAEALLYGFGEDGNQILVCWSEWINPGLNAKTRIGEKFEFKESEWLIIHELLADKKDNLCLHSNDINYINKLKHFRRNDYNFIMAPIYVKGKIHAVLDFTREVTGGNWSESEINLAVLVADVFSGAFERDAMERQFSIIEHSPNLSLYVTPEAEIEYINPAVNAVTGYTKSEIMAQGLGLIFSETALADLKDKYIPEALREEQILFETEINRKDGEQRILMNSIFQAGKNNFGIFASDLTEMRKLEADLVAAKEIAERNSRAKSEFLSRMSHEMLTPMNCLMGMMHIVKMQPQQAEQCFKEMDDALSHLLELIKNVLNMSEIEYDVFKLVLTEFSFKDIIYDILKSIGPHVETKKQRINYDINISMSQIFIGDRERLKQVLLNLLANAVKFTPENGEISLKADALSEDGNQVVLQIEIADNGLGIPEDQQDKLFAIFEQVNGGNIREHGGIGIGLPLSRRIIEMMGGRIWVESESGKGAKFTFTCELQKS